MAVDPGAQASETPLQNLGSCGCIELAEYLAEQRQEGPDE